MTTTRINHTGHNHPSTTAARTACRKAMKATPAIKLIPAGKVGRSDMIHAFSLDFDGRTLGAECGAGLGRGTRRNSPFYRLTEDLPVERIECARCAKRVA